MRNPRPTNLVAVCLCVASLMIAVRAQADQPNVIVIVTDDAGWADYGFMRNADSAADPGNRGAVPTPNLDRLADRGVTFTNAYTGSVCSASRAMITTGRYGTRFGYGLNIAGSSSAINSTPTPQGLPTSEVTIWERMQSVGYDTAAVGKWHIGAHSSGGGMQGNRPEFQGVEHFEGLWSGSRNYTVGGVTGDGQLRRTISDGAGSVSSNNVIEGNFSGQYVTDVFGDQSVDYIENNAAGSDPFFLYTSFTAPHTPMQATAADLAFIDSLNEPGFTGNRRTYAAMQYAMDRNIGKILDALDDPDGNPNTSDGIADDTMIVFINDNGGDCCDSGPNSSDNGDLRGGKGTQWEGGMRVPMIVAGAGVALPAQGTVSADLVHSIDIVPTAFIGAGEGTFGAGEAIDGENLLPYINGTAAGVAHDSLFISRYSSLQSGVRQGQWKYMYQNSQYQLYDLSTDIDESNNVINNPANEAIAAELHELMASYHVEMEKPRYDNQADDTNQFDHFQFRENNFSSATFSTSNAWTNGDTQTGNFTASWRDGYASNQLTFRAKASGSYTVTNDLTAWGGFAYMANQINLDGSGTPLAGQNTATINGLPVMMTQSLQGAGPTINLDANDATSGQFTFNVDLDVEVYDHLSIAGNGNQNFAINGDVREFRDGRNITKTGAANVTFGGEIDVTGTVDLQAGQVQFDDGRVSGSLVARNGTTIRVGPSGIVPGSGGGGNPPPLFTTGLDLQFDAATDIAGDALWTDTAGAADNINFAGSATPGDVVSAQFPALTKAYDISATGGASGLNDYFENSGPRSRQDAAFEVVFHVSDTAAGNDQILLEAGGENRGIAFVLNDDVLTFNVDGSAGDFDVDTAALSAGWYHAIGVIDLATGDDTISLYLNNTLVGSTSGTIDDWAGGNILGLGEIASSSTGLQGTAADYHGEIALARFYSNVLFTAAEVDQNYQTLLFQASTPGEPAVTLTVGGDWDFEAGAILELDLLDTNAFDRVDVAQTATIAGELQVSESAGFAPAVGDSFDIVSATNLTGEFSDLTLPSLSSDQMWQVLYSATDVSLLVTFAGDYNGDGYVDAADYTVWRDALGQSVTNSTGADGNGDGVVDATDYAVWRANFGAVPPSNLDAATVPEPATVLTAAAMIALLLVRQYSF